MSTQPTGYVLTRGPHVIIVSHWEKAEMMKRKTNDFFFLGSTQNVSKGDPATGVLLFFGQTVLKYLTYDDLILAERANHNKFG